MLTVGIAFYCFWVIDEVGHLGADPFFLLSSSYISLFCLGDGIVMSSEYCTPSLLLELIYVQSSIFTLSCWPSYNINGYCNMLGKASKLRLPEGIFFPGNWISSCPCFLFIRTGFIPLWTCFANPCCGRTAHASVYASDIGNTCGSQLLNLGLMGVWLKFSNNFCLKILK